MLSMRASLARRPMTLIYLGSEAQLMLDAREVDGLESMHDVAVEICDTPKQALTFLYASRPRDAVVFGLLRYLSAKDASQSEVMRHLMAFAACARLAEPTRAPPIIEALLQNSIQVSTDAADATGREAGAAS